MARASKDSGTSESSTTIYYAPDGREYPLNEDTATPAEKVNLRAWGYSTTKPDTADAEAAAVPLLDPGPLADTAPMPKTEG